jgi:hypothetical protein
MPKGITALMLAMLFMVIVSLAISSLTIINHEIFKVSNGGGTCHAACSIKKAIKPDDSSKPS